VVSDEDDHSFGDPRYFWRAFEQAKGIGNDGRVAVSAIAGGTYDPALGEVVPAQCTATGSPGERYWEVARYTGGLFGSVCDASFERTLRDFGRLAVGLQRRFALAATPDLSACPDASQAAACLAVTVRYRCDAPADTIDSCPAREDECANLAGPAYGIRCTPTAGGPDGWAYEPALNAVRFDGAALPGLGSEVEIVYRQKG
jgi:hypothetical protein